MNGEEFEEVLALVHELVRKSARAGIVCAGLLIRVSKDGKVNQYRPLVHFGNLTERGYQVGEFYRAIARMIEQKTREGKIEEQAILPVV